MSEPPADPLRDRLRRLRRETGPGKEAPPAPAAPVPTWLKHRLARGARAGSERVERDVGPRTVGMPADLEEFGGQEGSYAARLRRFPPDHRHGAWLLADVDHARRETIAMVARDPALAALDLRRAVYLDIETTGLSGGAGTVPFLVALGTFLADGTFEMWQGFLRGPEEERAMLAETARRIRAADGVVSFFGKSFDRHRLEDKMRVHGIAPPFSDRPHLDLFHPLRRLYAGGFDNGKLSTMERELCGLQRDDDLPGSFAPAAWFDFLADRAHQLEGVLQHNLDDVLSLVTLAAHLGRTEEEKRSGGTGLTGSALWRARGLSRIQEDERNRAAALAWSERALALDPEGARPWRLRHADLLRLAGRWKEALPFYSTLADEGEDEVAGRALLETAKIAEHRDKDRASARGAVVRARRIIERTVVGAARKRLLADCDRRAARLAD